MKPAVYSSGTKLYETEATDAPDVSAGTPAVPDTGAVPSAPSETGAKVNVIDQDGVTYSLPEGELGRALAQGYRVEKPEEKAIREYVDENKGLSGDVKVGLKSLASEATFGVLGAIADHTGDELERAKSEALKKAHTAANWIGGGAGFAASMLYGGEFLQEANAAGKAAELGILGTRLGEKAGAHVLEDALLHAAPEVGAKAAEVAPGLLRKMVASGAGTAVEGAIIAAPRAVTEAALGDPQQAAETLLYGAGGGALLGLVGPLGGEIKAGIKGGLSGFSAAESEAGEAAGKSAIGKIADKQAFRSIASNQASLKVALKEAKNVGGAEGVGETLNELGLIRNFRESPELYAERLKAARDEWGSKIGDLTQKLDTLGETPDAVKIFDRIKKDVIDPLASKPGFEAIQGGVQKYLDSFASKTLATEEGLTFGRLHDMRASLDDLVYREAKAASPVVEELRKVRAIIEDEFTSQGDTAARAAGKDFLVPWKEAKKTYGRLSAAKAGAEDYVAREATNRVLSPTDYGTGIGGAMLGAMTGSPLPAIGGALTSLAHSVVRTEGNGLVARALSAIDKGGLLGVEQAMKGVAEKLDTIPSVLDRLGNGKASAALATLPTHALTDLITSMNVGNGEHKGEHFATLSDQLTALATDPARMAAKIAEITGPYAKAAPNIARAYETALASTVGYLQQKMPKKPEAQSPFAPPTTWRPSDAQLADFSRRIETALDPFVVLKRLEDRTLGKPEIETLQALYPKIYDKIRQRVIEHPREIPYSDRLKLGRLLGATLDRSMRQLGTYQGVFAADAAKGAAQGSRPRSSGRSIRADKLPSGESEFQRIAAKG